jgi:hypothetical protein
MANLTLRLSEFSDARFYKALEKSGAGAEPNRITSRSLLYRCAMISRSVLLIR